MKTSFASTGKSNGKSKLLFWLAGLLCFAFITQNIRAGETDPATDPASPSGEPAGDPPSRVARISFVDGTVSFQPGGQGDWGSAAMNRPVTVGDKLWADKASRAELQVGQASIHIGSMTALSFLNLDENIMQLRVAEGAVNFRVRELREGDVYEVDTPNLAFTVRQAGAFRVDVSENGDATVITAIRGEGEVSAAGKTFPVHAGDRAEFDGVDTPEYKVTAAPAPDGLDRWAAERDLREDNSTSSKYVSPDVPGTADLDDNGTWSEQPDNGPIWYPNEVAPGWAPYSDGYWNYVGPWGWTWIGYEPWGFAPYHYGRWGFVGGRWGWSPGPIYARPFYGPAFVGFLGGPGFGVGFGFGAGFGVGWFPLGFHEPFYPGFRASRVYLNNINIHNTAIRNVSALNAGAHSFNYAYAHNAAAVTAASRSAFVGGQAINRGAAHITEASLRGAEVSNRTSFSPTRQSSFGAANLKAGATPPSSVQSRSVVARTAPSGMAANTAVRAASTNGLSSRSASSFASRMPQTTARSNQLSQGRPPSVGGAPANRTATGGRSWAAQGNSTDHGTAPQGFGSSSRPANTGSTQSAGVTHSDRPPWAGASAGGAGTRSYEPASRTYSAPSRSYSSPRSSYPATRSNAAPSHSTPAPAHSSGGGGGSHGGGGGSHGGGGHH